LSVLIRTIADFRKFVVVDQLCVGSELRCSIRIIGSTIVVDVGNEYVEDFPIDCISTHHSRCGMLDGDVDTPRLFPTGMIRLFREKSSSRWDDLPLVVTIASGNTQEWLSLVTVHSLPE
jgi:hypothetical protein